MSLSFWANALKGTRTKIVAWQVSMDVGKLIQKGRQAKEMTQKDLATKICEKPQVVTEYESGKAVPNQAILGKLERALDMKLRGKSFFRCAY